MKSLNQTGTCSIEVKTHRQTIASAFIAWLKATASLIRELGDYIAISALAWMLFYAATGGAL